MLVALAITRQPTLAYDWGEGVHMPMHPAHEPSLPTRERGGSCPGASAARPVYDQSRGVSSSSLQLSRNGAPGRTTTDTVGYFAVPPDSATFTADDRMTLDNNPIPGPPGSHSAWTFTSAAKLIGVHGSDTYLAIVPAADLSAGGAISLHATATDPAGNAIDQTLTDFIAVR